MKVFISWSGDRSRAVALSLRELVATIIQAADVTISEHDIRAGERWRDSIAESLMTADAGIACITSDNINSPWLSYEAGVLSSNTEIFIPLLVDISPTDLNGPLAFYQALTLTRSDMNKLVSLLNSRLPSPLRQELVERLLERLWPYFEQELANLPLPRGSGTVSADPTLFPPLRSDREMLEEILELVRSLVRSKN